MAIKVACFTYGGNSRSKLIASAMAQGIIQCGDKPVIAEIGKSDPVAHVAVMYGWKHNRFLKRYPKFIYADLGYWGRDRYYRFSGGGWSPHRYVSAGLNDSRFNQLGIHIDPWKESGSEIIVAGSTRKAAMEHGYNYMDWEARACNTLRAMGLNVVYRPKPNDKEAHALPGVGYDTRSIKEALSNARGWVTHHSNSAIDALVEGVPVHCATGAAAALSVPIETMANPPRLAGREQFLHDVAWLQWTVDEMRSGAAWNHFRERGLC